MTIYFEESYDPSLDDSVRSMDIFKEVAALFPNVNEQQHKQFFRNREKLIERRAYLRDREIYIKVIEEYCNGN